MFVFNLLVYKKYMLKRPHCFIILCSLIRIKSVICADIVFPCIKDDKRQMVK